MGTACKSCGAEIVFEASQQSLACPYCGTVNQINRDENSLITTFDRIVPMAVTPQELDQRVYAYMASGDMTPDDMLEVATITRRERYYVAAYGFRIDYDATWSASFGFDREEPYTAYRDVARGNRTEREAYTDYRTVTDWRPASGADNGSFEVAGVGGKKLAGLSLAADTLAVDAVLRGKSTAYDEAFTRGLEVEGFSVPHPQVFASLTEKINDIIEQGVKRHAQGDRQRDWNWQTRLSHDVSSYAVPVCHVTFLYREKEYNVWIGGHDPEQILADALPVDSERKSAANMGYLPAIFALIACIGGASYWGFSKGSLLAPLLAFLYGALRRMALVNYSKSVRNALQTQRQISNQLSSGVSDQEQAKLAKAFERPERSLLAKVGLDMIVLPLLTIAAIAGSIIPAILAR